MPRLEIKVSGLNKTKRTDKVARRRSSTLGIEKEKIVDGITIINTISQLLERRKYAALIFYRQKKNY